MFDVSKLVAKQCFILSTSVALVRMPVALTLFVLV